MKILRVYCLSAFIALSTSVIAQNNAVIDEKPFIEVNGTSEIEITPDQIYINITIKEKYENKEKVTIESQEEKLKSALKEIGIDVNNLNLSDANANYVKVRYKTKDVLTQKEYILKVSDAKIVGQVFLQLDKLDITDAYIGKVSHTKIDSLKREVRIMAIKAAKKKADYLLLAIGEQTGKALIVKEKDNENIYYNYSNRNEMRTASYQNVRFIDDGDDLQKDEIQFRKIKIQSSIYVKFGIK